MGQGRMDEVNLLKCVVFAIFSCEFWPSKENDRTSAGSAR